MEGEDEKKSKEERSSLKKEITHLSVMEEESSLMNLSVNFLFLRL